MVQIIPEIIASQACFFNKVIQIVIIINIVPMHWDAYKLWKKVHLQYQY